MGSLKIRKMHLLTVGSAVIILLVAVFIGGGDAPSAQALPTAHVGISAKIDPPQPTHPAAAGWTGEKLYGRHNDWEPAVAADPSAPNLYMVSTRFGAHPACTHCPKPFLVIKRSSDNGQTWGPSGYLCRCKGLRWQYDPSIASDAAGNLYASFLSNGYGTYFTKSTDDGQTWSKPVDVIGDVKWSDHGWITVSDSGMDIYIGFSFHDNYQVTSHDGGITWSASVKTNSDGLYWYANGATVTPGGTVVFANPVYGCCPYNQYADKRPVEMWVTRSTDNGATWQSTKVGEAAVPPVCRSYGCPVAWYAGLSDVASDDVGNLIYVYSGGTVKHGPQQIWFTTSADGGATWSLPKSISPPDIPAAGFPSVAATGAGDFRVTWMDIRNGPRRANIWFRQSTDGGATWGETLRLSNEGHGAGYKHPKGFQFFYGDYGGLAITNTGKTVAVWGEGYSWNGPGNTWFNIQT